jgi:UDP-galactopyranose mutase
MVDEWQGMEGIPSSMVGLTQAMLEHADVTIVPSRRLLERYKSSARRIELLRHGADTQLFGAVADGTVSADPTVLRMPGKKIGYYGALHKLDIGLIAKVAKSRADWTFIFVGPLSGGQGIRRHMVLPSNVHFVGEKVHASLPEFLASLDVFWMPFVVNELTESMCPIKIFEVLSAGVPLISSDLDECRSVAGEHILFARNANEHVSQLARAMNLLHPEEICRRSRSMQGHDWDHRYQEFLRLLQ